MSRDDKSQPENLDLFPDLPRKASQAESRPVASAAETNAKVPVRKFPFSPTTSKKSSAEHVQPCEPPKVGMPIPFLSVHRVAERYGISKATVWRWAKERPDFPQPVKLGSGATRWRKQELDVFEAALGEEQ